ncbi:D-hexose-6-phosphate mutarotase [Shewanella sp. JM162201]|uniref:Putative glucose-6-phosphate 1-epimerase n=1 Tax=Shewanella jiangmenensis TaxID=2837387 RepID=A0ABS5V5M8_9GAMM|nr:D-hexose-6-phosphate mutarotase [Shewanella jiangmenensis]MBT1445764.1 D-hexose-6-phosphate mutarotase [Shewanella jiangmenensis]
MASVNTRKHPQGLDYVEVETRLCKARIFLQGAQIDFFQPAGKEPLLWVSSEDDYKPGSGIRGGIPVCWPWFGMHSEPGFAQHGFARTRNWKLTHTRMANEEVELVFSLDIAEEDRQFWPHNTAVEVHFHLTETLKVTLVNRNLGDTTVSLTQALHTYFPIKDIHALTAKGFSGAKYIEFGEGPYAQEGDEVRFVRETDRVYTDLGEVQTLHTPDGVIEVARENSRSAVLWNPWIDKSKWLARFGDEDYLTMVCLEAANVLEDKVVLEPGQTHALSTSIRWL